MEKEKKSRSFRKLGKFFKSKSADPEKGSDEVQTREEQLDPGYEAIVKEPPASEEHTLHVDVYMETKRKPFGSWRHKKKSRNSLARSPPTSPGSSNSSDRSFDAPDGDHQLRPYSMIVNSSEDPQILMREANINFQENMSRSPSAELSKKDSTKKPVLGKFGNLFSTAKKKQSKSVPESPTSPTNEKSERERKRAQVLVASSSKLHNQAPGTSSVEYVSNQQSQLVSTEPVSHIGQSLKVNFNGNSDIRHTSESKNSVKVTGESSIVEPESPVLSPDVFSDVSQRSPLSPTFKVDRQSTEKIVRQLIQSPGRRSSTDGEGKVSIRKVSQEIHIVKNGSPKVLTKKTTKFSSRVSDPKFRISERSVQKLGSTEKINSTKVTSPVAFGGDAKHQVLQPGQLKPFLDTAGGSSSLDKPVSSVDSSPCLTPSEGDIFNKPLEDKSKDENSSENGKVLAFDIYLSKTSGTDSQSSIKGSSSEDTMEKSPNRKINRKRRSLKSQNSQEENNAENTALQDNVFDESNNEGVREYSNTPDGVLKAASPESNGSSSANQELKAGTNNKLSPKGESDKDKQQHPASSPMRKKNSSAPSSPTDRKAHDRDSVFRNQTAAASAKATEFNQPVPVSTTNDAYVEKASVPESLAGCVGESSSNTAEEDSRATTIGGVDRRTKQESKQGEQKLQSQRNTNQASDSNGSKLHVAPNDSLKSTVTSKLNIPPKPKNVELPIKSKVVDNVEEGTIEAIIPKGNIASKVSLFESKRTSHKQIDFYATKNISQKKYVERTKLNFGKQVKGSVSKENSSLGKQSSISSNSIGKKAENGHHEIKADKKKEGTVVTSPSQIQMEHRKNGFELAVPDKILRENILPSEKNEKHKKLTEKNSNSDALGESISTQTNGSKLDEHTKNTLTQSPENTSDYLVAVSADSEGGAVSPKDPPDMGNKHNSIKEPSDAVVSKEDDNVGLTKESKTLHSDAVCSSLHSTVSSSTEQLQFSDSKEMTEVEREDQTLTSKRKSTGKSPETRMEAEKIQSQEALIGDAKEDLKKLNAYLKTSQEGDLQKSNETAEAEREAKTTSVKNDTARLPKAQIDIEKNHPKEVSNSNSKGVQNENTDSEGNPEVDLTSKEIIRAETEAQAATSKSKDTGKSPKARMGIKKIHPKENLNPNSKKDVQRENTDSEGSQEVDLPISKEMTEVKRETQTPTSDGKHTEKSIKKEMAPEKIQPKDVLNHDDKDVSKENTDLEANHVVDSNELKMEITHDTAKQLPDTIKEQSNQEAIQEKFSLHGNSDLSHSEKESGATAEPDLLNAIIPAGQEQTISDQQNHLLQNLTIGTIKASDGAKLEGLYTENPFPQIEDGVHASSESSQLKSGEFSVLNNFSPQNKLSTGSDKESESTFFHDVNNFSKPNTKILTDLTKGIVSCPAETAKDDRSIYESNEHQGDFNSTLSRSSRENELELQNNVAGVEEMSEKHTNTKAQQVNLLNTDDINKAIVSTEVDNKSTPNRNVVDSGIPDPTVPENGYLFDSHAITYTNGSLQHRVTQSFTNVQSSPETSFNDSVASEEYTLDSSSDMEKFAETIRRLESPINLPQKRKKPRAPKSPGPYYGLPPIREDYLEKILDNDAFSFGLGKKDRAKELAPMALFKMQSKETAEKLKPKRASAAQSMLLKSLKSKGEPLSIPQETCDKENADVTDLAVKRSRIESIYSGFKSPFAARSEENVFSPSVTTVSTITTSFDTPRKEFTPSGKTCDLKTTDSVTTAHTSVKEGKGAFTQPSSEFLLSDSAEQSVSIPVHSMDRNQEGNIQANGDLSLKLPDSNGHLDVNHSTPEGNRTAPLFDSISALDKPDSSEIFYFKGQEQSIPDSSEVLPLKDSEKVNPRPGKVVILTEPEYGGAVFEIFSDVIDCTSWELSPTIFIKTVRGCWILYELPNYEGRTIALEEGDIEVTNPWGDESQDENSQSPVIIGSLRHVVKDYRVCRIDLFTDPDGLGVMTSYYDDTEEVQVYGRLQRTCSVKVHCGVWLIYEESGFQGVPFILEPGEYPDLSFLNIQEAYIGSTRPLKMGSRKVEIPHEPKIVIFEKPLFEGRQVELDKDMLTLKNVEISDVTEEQEPAFNTVGSMRVLSGLWVGYEKPGYEGHQYLLEEGDYEEWRQWGGYNGLLQSLRPILSDFSTPHMVMYSEKDFDEKASNINVLGIISNMEETGFGVKIQSINILSGVWVAYESPDFTGEQYILEKGMYSNFSDWGAKNCKITSLQPILMEALESPGHFRVEVFSESDFKGERQLLEEDSSNLEEPFKIMSCKVISGRWAAYDQADFSGSLWVLEEGSFPNLCAMGCPHGTVIRSVKTIKYEFSDPSLVLYGKENHKGRRVKLGKETTDLRAMGYSPDLRSLDVLGGIWVFYEYENYRGRQLLVAPTKIAQWSQFSGWNKIGSLRPLRQKRLYFKLQNKSNGMFMSTNGSLNDIKLLRIQVMEDTGVEDQIWVYHKGVFRCRIAEDCTLASAGTVITTGSKLGLSLEQTGASMLWTISPDGRIYCRSKSNFVLDIKGGNQYDQQHIVLNPVTEGKLSQLWEICVL
ncbi:beta/gamma crystallin domain-containing protein 1 isoform X2 [Phyllobates terribilis]|uniref:beta/gamma crystallin domain-containing protein 1 isoform X2 n=2 Tax=Phyllobates terribilis TaxID=111132 RepID=UPI003CCAA494